MKAISLLFIYCLLWQFSPAQNIPSIQWSHLYGGSNLEFSGPARLSHSGNIIVTGYTSSAGAGITGSHGNSEMWLLNLESNAGLQNWNRCLGGSAYEDIASNGFDVTFDNGIIVAGFTNSTDGDVSGLHATPNQTIDAWVVKLDSSGNVAWQKCLGGTEDEETHSIMQTADSGYIFIGNTHSSDGDVTEANKGGMDVWVVKLDQQGSIQWQKSIGGTNTDVGDFILQSKDGNFIIAGSTRSVDLDMAGSHGPDGQYDAYVMKLDKTNGDILWQKFIGGSQYDWAEDILENTDGSIMLAVQNGSQDGDFDSLRRYDFCLVKIDTAQNIEFIKTYGGSKADLLYSIVKSKEGGYLLTGISRSDDGDVSSHYGLAGGQEDLWVVKVDDTGMLLWEKNFGGSYKELLPRVTQMPDTGYVIVAPTNSNDYDLASSTPHGDYDLWVFKLGGFATGTNDVAIQNTIKIYPIPASNTVHIELPRDVAHLKFRLKNMLGQEVACQTTKADNKHYQLQGLSPGIYTLTITGDKFHKSQKLIIK